MTVRICPPGPYELYRRGRRAHDDPIAMGVRVRAAHRRRVNPAGGAEHAREAHSQGSTGERPAAPVADGSPRDRPAAGAGTRMRSATPKVLHELGGRADARPRAARRRRRGPEHLVAVVGHQLEQVTGGRHWAGRRART
ncbi:hypothetical protein HBB16_02785 [Pseudonocardia sp. MCCB 268]|nr:hypothetical protein [Pseudonocardia cytotoxica]